MTTNFEKSQMNRGVLIDGFIDAIDNWMGKTGHPEYSIIAAVWSHMGRSALEVFSPRFDLRDELNTQSESTSVILLISGLVKFIVMQFIAEIENYEANKKSAQRVGQFYTQVVDDPSLLVKLNEIRLGRGQEPITLEIAKVMAESALKSANSIDDNPGERAMTLHIWQEVTKPLWVLIQSEVNTLNSY